MHGDVRFRHVGRYHGSAAIAGVAMAFRIDNDRDVGLFTEVDQGAEQGIGSDDAGEAYITAKGSEIRGYVPGATKGIGLGTYLDHWDRCFRGDTTHISP